MRLISIAKEYLDVMSKHTNANWFRFAFLHGVKIATGSVTSIGYLRMDEGLIVNPVQVLNLHLLCPDIPEGGLDCPPCLRCEFTGFLKCEIPYKDIFRCKDCRRIITGDATCCQGVLQPITHSDLQEAVTLIQRMLDHDGRR